MIRFLGGEEMLSENTRNKWMHNLENYFSLEYTPKCVRGDKELVLCAVERDGMNLAFASDELKDDIDVVSLAIDNNINSFQFASKRLQEQIVKYGVVGVKKMQSDVSYLESLELIGIDVSDELMDSIIEDDVQKRNFILGEDLMSLINKQIEISESIRRIQSMMLDGLPSNIRLAIVPIDNLENVKVDSKKK